VELSLILKKNSYTEQHREITEVHREKTVVQQTPKDYAINPVLEVSNLSKAK